MRVTKKDLHDFSIRLKKAREDFKYTQKQLAEISGVNIKTIKRLENFEKKDNPSPLALNLLFLSQALDVTPEYLLLGEDNMNIYMKKLESELKALTIDEIRHYHRQNLTDKVLSHLKLTDTFIKEIWQYWNEHTIVCRRPYVQDAIIRYCHNRPR
ncbi:MAG: helix-turn-helix domain-containing protein [Lachnospiraceae bacterium]|nr:helix-turn-helix domain-containing protein [Lachnospiraceae bacterium]